MTNKIVGQGFSLAALTLLLATIVYLSVSCAPSIRTEQAKNEKSQKIFLNSLAILEEYLEGKTTSLKDFNKAVDLLERTTNIGFHREHDFVGTRYLDSNLLVEDIQRWKDWYDQNKDKLYWDEKQKKIIVKER